jgi:hypothetical protein
MNSSSYYREFGIHTPCGRGGIKMPNIGLSPLIKTWPISNVSLEIISKNVKPKRSLRPYNPFLYIIIFLKYLSLMFIKAS